MTIGTIEELEALPPGTQVVVDSKGLGRKTWLRTEKGWNRNAATLPSGMFHGAVSAGRVVRADQVLPEEWSWWTSGPGGTTVCVVVSTDTGTGTAQIARFRDRQWGGFMNGLDVGQFGPSGWTRVEPLPWMLSVEGLLIMHLALVRSTANLDVELSTLRDRVEQMEHAPPVSTELDVAALARAMRQHARANGYNLSRTGPNTLGALMRRFNLPVVAPGDRFLVEAWGQARQQIPVDQIRGLVTPLPEGVEYGNNDILGTQQVTFPYRVSFRFGADDRSEITRHLVVTKVQEALPGRSIRSVDYTVTDTTEAGDKPAE
jgi:hypothetical protein